MSTPNATVAQPVERRSANAEVGGSNPLGRSWVTPEVIRLLDEKLPDWRGAGRYFDVEFPVAPVEGESFVIERPSFSTQYVRVTLHR